MATSLRNPPRTQGSGFRPYRPGTFGPGEPGLDAKRAEADCGGVARWMAARLLVAAGVLMVAGGAACSSSTAAPATTSTANDRAAVLAAAAAVRVARDNSFGDPDIFKRVDVVERFGRLSSDMGLPVIGPESPLITGEERLAIEQALAPRQVSWVPSLESIVGTGPPPELVLEDRAVLFFAEPVIEASRATVVSGLYCGSACGIGGAHTLELDGAGAWKVTGFTGPQWMA